MLCHLTANFADSYVPDGFKQGFSACVGGLNIFCGILGTLMSFLKYAEVYEAHRISAVAWSSLGRNIEIELKWVVRLDGVDTREA